MTRPMQYAVASLHARTWSGITFRSKAERRYAERLQLLTRAEWSQRVASWRYEPESFKLVCGGEAVATYKPDFLVEYADGRTEYHEVKGQMLAVAALKLKMFAACYPQHVLRVIDAKTLRERTPAQRANLRVRVNRSR